MTNGIKTANNFANSVLDNYWDGIFPVDPIAIANRFGIKVFYDNLPTGVSGALVKTENMDAPIIMVDESEPKVRKRFTVAHEIGHYLYNTLILKKEGVYRKIDYRGQLAKEGIDCEEIFANKFAAALLMPEKELKSKGNVISLHHMFKLASDLDVSPESLRYRLQSIGIQYDE